jgi:hypothetical protein
MGGQNIAGDGQPQPGAAFVAIAAFVEPGEAIKDVVASGRGDTRPVVGYRHFHRRATLGHFDGDG